ncbi:ImmA/IrrE family metallo-endopeptidase [Acinetobacter baumannii]|nr:ImmA/IrrE family metallo-endopeptidase [Acinetobacter baumannii]MDC5331600.1 ImmA/IrrE family metallo-endopeptidase [Acinetobacter baumannii]MDC5385127.1 ImmA/IrrE family metallo-endopeptidase [Acinetobacter baumannii]MDC5523462.1 ImmA/IrrE family metallo-endopeptidase [Acinetobacter baumannii]MDC5641049.1 ImmA/IrrE family metallo-endopeptidase [Acinetobacter baumannii]
MDDKLSPPKAANRLLKIIDVFFQAQSLDKFPINVDMLAYEAANIFKWNDPITEIKEVPIKRFDGALFKKNIHQWTILYNPTVESSGRILFTKAHELGHYILHRTIQDEFLCGTEDLQTYDIASIETEANKFSSYLLMPIDDFRRQIDQTQLIQSLSLCALRYGVSLTAAILKWLEFTEESVILINSRDGFMNWAVSSRSAKNNGAFFKTKKNIIEIPEQSLASNSLVPEEKNGEKVQANIWFPYAHKDASVIEYKITSERFDHILTLILLPRNLKVWKKRE